MDRSPLDADLDNEKDIGIGMIRRTIMKTNYDALGQVVSNFLP